MITNTITKKIEEIKNKQTEMNNTITEIKNTLKGTNSRITEAEKWISELKYRMVEIIAEEPNKGKGMKRLEESLRDLWDNIKCTNSQVIRVPEEEEKKKGNEKNFELIIVENFLNMGKKIVNQVQDAQKVPYRLNPRRNTLSHIIIKLTEIKHKEGVLKAAREKQQVTYKGKPIWLTEDLPAETLQVRRKWQDIFKVLKEKKIYNQDYYTQQRPHSKLKEK